jgi:hypothetical protein
MRPHRQRRRKVRIAPFAWPRADGSRAFLSEVPRCGSEFDPKRTFACSVIDGQIGPDAKSIASDLIGHISKEQVQESQAGKPADWRRESFQVAKDDAYGQLPQPNAHGSYELTEDLCDHGNTRRDIAAEGLGRRLALILKWSASAPAIGAIDRSVPDTTTRSR